ncbi:MAG: P63C domain-containing protein [Bacteroidota bacterium]|nr:P63C domain-containing protein [Bacteroidota bacterium]
MSKKRNVKYDGVLELTDQVSIDCYVLEDGTRVLSGREMQRALNMVDDEDSSKTSGARLNRYLNQKSLNPFIFKDKEPGHFDPIECYKGDKKINGFEASVLIDICDAFLEARKEIKLSARQQIIADQCEILMRSFAKVGLIALIDEATGYQYDREQKELQTILKALVSDEILEYQQQFQLSFYREIFRLWGIPFTPKNIQRKPQFIGHLTNKYVYQNLPKGVFVLEELKSKTPKTKKGNYKYRLHQSLTEDKGREALKKVLYSIETLASISKNKREFDKLVQQRYGQQSIPFEEVETIRESEENQMRLQFESPKNDFDQKLTQALNYDPKGKSE